MPTYPFFRVNAFTSEPFKGNPAAVMILTEWLPDSVLQAIATEINLAETAFVVAKGRDFELRWFSPTVEISLCGHATLATAHVLFEELGYSEPDLWFNTRERGTLVVRRDEASARLVMDFPATPIRPTLVPDTLVAILGVRPVEVLRIRPDRDFLVILDSVEAVRTLKPDLAAFESLKVDAIAVTAEAEPDAEEDIVCRYFGPGYGIPEDPVTGALHTWLVPMWAKRLGKEAVISRQMSPRGGLLYCRDLGERVEIAGDAILTLRGEIVLP